MFLWRFFIFCGCFMSYRGKPFKMMANQRCKNTDSLYHLYIRCCCLSYNMITLCCMQNARNLPMFQCLQLKCEFCRCWFDKMGLCPSFSLWFTAQHVWMFSLLSIECAWCWSVQLSLTTPHCCWVKPQWIFSSLFLNHAVQTCCFTGTIKLFSHVLFIWCFLRLGSILWEVVESTFEINELKLVKIN